MSKPRIAKDTALCPTDRRELVRGIRVAVMGLRFEEICWCFLAVLEHRAATGDVVMRTVARSFHVVLETHYGPMPLGYERGT